MLFHNLLNRKVEYKIMIVISRNKKGLSRFVNLLVQIRRCSDRQPIASKLRLKSPAQLDLNQMRDKGQVPSRQELRNTAELKRQLEDKEGIAAFDRSAGGSGGAAMISKVFIWSLNFGFVLSSLWWTIFMLVDVGVPIPDFRSETSSRLPLRVSLSWLPLLVIPSAFTAAVMVPYSTRRMGKFMDTFADALKGMFVTRRVGDVTVRRKEHESGVNSLLKKRSDPNWNEKGLDISVLLNVNKKE